jgi:hypothetical protein
MSAPHPFSWSVHHYHFSVVNHIFNKEEFGFDALSLLATQEAFIFHQKLHACVVLI